MERKKAALLLVILGLIVIISMLGFLWLSESGASEQADVSLSLDDDILTVSIESMNDSAEVTVLLEGEEEGRMVESGEELTVTVKDGQTVTVKDRSDIITQKIVSVSDNGSTEDPSDPPTEEIPFDGSGTENEPYEISTVDDLQAIHLQPKAHYIITEDIDASETENWNDGAGFEPIPQFEGTIDGQNHMITGLVINRPDDSRVGIFRRTTDASIERIKMTEVEVQGSQQVGGIAGSMENTEVRSVTVSGFISGEQDVGMIAGTQDSETTINEG